MSGPACATSRGDRLFFAGMAVFVGLVAGSMLTSGNYLCGIPALICTTFLTIGAITGWCPSQLLQRKNRETETVSANVLGIPEVSGVIELRKPRSK